MRHSQASSEQLPISKGEVTQMIDKLHKLQHTHQGFIQNSVIVNTII